MGLPRLLVVDSDLAALGRDHDDELAVIVVVRPDRTASRGHRLRHLDDTRRPPGGLPHASRLRGRGLCPPPGPAGRAGTRARWPTPPASVPRRAGTRESPGLGVPDGPATAPEPAPAGRGPCPEGSRA